MSVDPKKTFTDEVAKPEAVCNLAHAALLVVQHLTRPFKAEVYLNVLDNLADRLRPLLEETRSDLETVQIFNEYFFRKLGFSGNAANYYHPHNSFLNYVLDLRAGIPVTLSVVYLELARRLQLPVVGISFPGHFLVAYQGDGGAFFIDPFNQGRLLSEDDCMDMAQVPEADRLHFRQDYLQPVSKSVILFRMLQNLKQIYVTLEDWLPAYKTVELMLTLQPGRKTEIRDKGLIAWRLGRRQDAIFNIKQYLLVAPANEEAAWLQNYLHTIEAKQSRLN